jgi:hypothetical protein
MTQSDPVTSARDIHTLSEEYQTVGAALVEDLYWHLVGRNGRGVTLDEAREYLGRLTTRFRREILRSWLDRLAPGPVARANSAGHEPRGTVDDARGAAPGRVDPPPVRSDRAQRQSLDGQDPPNPNTAYLLSRAAGLSPAGFTNTELLAMAAGTHAADHPTRPATPPKSGQPQPIETGEVEQRRGTAPRQVTPSARLIVEVHLPRATVDQAPTDPRYEHVEETAFAAVRAWITHPAVGREVVAAKSALHRLVEPLGLAEQWAITLVTARFLDIAGRYPDGSKWPDPFIEAPAAVVASARQIGPRFVEALSSLAQRLARAGVPLDPFDRSVLLVLAQLALLDIDVAHLTAEIVDDLNVLPPGWIDREWAERGHVVTGAGLHGRTTRFHAVLASIGEDVARDLSPLGAIHAPYAKGGRRESPSETIRLRAALASLAEQDPTLTPGTLLADVVGNEHPGLQQVRDAMGWAEGHVPELRRIERNWPKSRQ